MNSFSNNLEKNELHFNYSSSLINILYYPNVSLNKYSFFKNNNDVIISFKDTVINKTIYVTSSGLKRNSVFQSEDFDKMLAKKELSTFVSYFKTLEDDVFRFDLYPKAYKKAVQRAFIKKESTNELLYSKLLPTKNLLFRAKYFNKYKFFNQNCSYNGSFDKKFIIKLRKKKICLATTRGIVLPRLSRFHYNNYRVMSGLITIFKRRGFYKQFSIIISSNYRLLRFFTKNFQNSTNNVNSFINVLLYYHFAKFTFKAFFKKRDKLKIKWRKSNKYIFKYFLRRHKKISKFVNLFFKLILHKSILTFQRSAYINTLSLYKKEIFLNINNNAITLKNEEKTSSSETIVNLLGYFIKILPLYLIHIINFKIVHLERIHIYFLFKAFILKEYLITKFSQFNLFIVKKINEYIIPIFSSKGLVKINTYPSSNVVLNARRLHWTDYIKNKKATVQIRVNLGIKNFIRHKKRFVNKLNVLKSKSLVLKNNYINNSFIKFYQFYILAKKNKRMFGPGYNIKRLIQKKVLKFTKRYKVKRKIAIRFFRKLFKIKKVKQYHGKRWKKWQKKLLKSRKIRKMKKLTFRKAFKKLLKKRIKNIFIPKIKPKFAFKKTKNYNKKSKNSYQKFLIRPKKIKIYKTIKSLINKLKPKRKKIVTPEYVIPKFTRVRREPKKIL